MLREQLDTPSSVKFRLALTWPQQARRRLAGRRLLSWTVLITFLCWAGLRPDTRLMAGQKKQGSRLAFG